MGKSSPEPAPAPAPPADTGQSLDMSAWMEEIRRMQAEAMSGVSAMAASMGAMNREMMEMLNKQSNQRSAAQAELLEKQKKRLSLAAKGRRGAIKTSGLGVPEDASLQLKQLLGA